MKVKKENTENYCPISVLCTLSKILERRVHQEFYSYLTNANLLLSEQPCFRPQHSCESSLTSITDSWISSMNEGKMIGALFIGLQKAFDSIDHSILLRKLKVYGCDELTLKWLTSYLADIDTKRLNTMKHHLNFKPSNVGYPTVLFWALCYLLFL